MIITVTIPEEQMPDGMDEQTVRLIMQDAFYEYAERRRDAQSYVENRYSLEYRVRNLDKVAITVKRVAIARVLWEAEKGVE